MLKKKLFVSDLDRTLIYSLKASACSFEELALLGWEIEEVRGKNISWIAKKAFSSLERITKKSFFVPVTTRSFEQYKRISSKLKALATFSIVSNGGNVIIDDKIDYVWQAKVKEKIAKTSLPAEKILTFWKKQEISSAKSELLLVDQLFYYTRLKEDYNFLSNEFQNFKKALLKYGWHFLKKDKKIYLVPLALQKGSAVKYISQKLKAGEIMAAGDSVLDLSMLKLANYAIVPKGSELWELREKNAIKKMGFNFTKQNGLQASEEILNLVSQILKGDK